MHRNHTHGQPCKKMSSSGNSRKACRRSLEVLINRLLLLLPLLLLLLPPCLHQQGPGDLLL